MCGIAGVLDLAPGLEPAEALVREMTETIAHRGPDEGAVFVDPPIVLGHRRLSIIDLSPTGRQPMASDDGSLWITYNGEIYNYRELARDLKQRGHSFRGTSDTEVLLRAYEEWGPDCLRRLNGMFAFAIWNRARGSLFCARDRLGVKPFYYTTSGGRFRFASEIKALLVDPSVPRIANDDRVMDFLARGLIDHTAETLFDGVVQLPPGTHMSVSASGERVGPVTWWEPRPAERDGRPAHVVLRELLVDAVELRLRSDVPVATTLSGGLDSGSVVSIASEVRRREGAEPPVAYVSRTADARIDEWEYAEQVLARSGAHGRQFHPDPEHLLGSLDRLLWHLEEPFHSAGSYAYWSMMALARASGTVVVLDGQGGDEALAGYHYLLYPAAYLSLLRSGKPRQALGEVLARRRLNRVGFQQTILEIAKHAMPLSTKSRRRPVWLGRTPRLPKPPVAGRSLAAQHLSALTTRPLPHYNHAEDREAMSWGVETRNPFLDYRIIEFGLGCRPEELLRGGLSKWVLREAMRDLLPRDVVERAQKQGFTTDEAHWMRGSLGVEMSEAFASDEMGRRPYFDRDALLRTLASHHAGDNRQIELWRAFMVERWLRLFVDAPRLTAPPSPSGLPAFTPRPLDRVISPNAAGAPTESAVAGAGRG